MPGTPTERPADTASRKRQRLAGGVEEQRGALAAAMGAVSRPS